MTQILQPSDRVKSETHELYLHLLNLRTAAGEPATDRSMMHRDLAKSPECKAALLDAESLERYCSGDKVISADQLSGLREALDRAHRKVVDPKFTWKPSWLNAPQNMRNAHPSITNHSLHHHPV